MWRLGHGHGAKGKASYLQAVGSGFLPSHGHGQATSAPPVVARVVCSLLTGRITAHMYAISAGGFGLGLESRVGGAMRLHARPKHRASRDVTMPSTSTPTLGSMRTSLQRPLRFQKDTWHLGAFGRFSRGGLRHGTTGGGCHSASAHSVAGLKLGRLGLPTRIAIFILRRQAAAIVTVP